MIRNITALVAAAALAATAMTPAASARDYHHRGGNYGGHGYYGHDYGRYHRGDAAAVGALGLVLGLAIGSAIANSNNDRGCYDRCGYAPPRPRQYQGYDPGRGGPPPSDYRDGSAYEEDYGIDPKLDGGPQAQSCTHQERQWDRYANRYVTVDVPC